MEFFKKKEPTQQLSSKCSGATTACGRVFGNITI
jgi:hypothetical protein